MSEARVTQTYRERSFFTLKDIMDAAEHLRRNGRDPDKAEFRFFPRHDLDGRDLHELNIYSEGK